MTLAQTHVSAWERLENRVLFAVASNDFFPLAPGETWSYAAEYEGQSATIKRTMVATGATVRVDDKTSVAGQTVVLSRSYSKPGGSLRLHQQVASGGGGIAGTVNMPTAMPVLTKAVGDVVGGSWSKLTLDAALSFPEVGTVKPAGSDTGRTTVTTLSRLDQDGWVFTNVKLANIDHTQTYTAKVAGTNYTLTARTIERAYLMAGVGMVKGSIDVSATLSGGGESETENVSQSFELDSSTLLQGFALVKNGALRIAGTSGNDQIGVGYDGTASKLLVVRNGIGRVFSTSGVYKIIVDAGAGDDVITITKAGRYRTLIVGGTGNDKITTGGGRDYLSGGTGNDSLYAGSSEDTLLGDAGNDYLDGQLGTDTLDGGADRDTAVRDTTDLSRVAVEVLV